MYKLISIIFTIVLFNSCANPQEEALFNELEASYVRGSEFLTLESKWKLSELKFILSDEAKTKFYTIVLFAENEKIEFAKIYKTLSNNELSIQEIESSVEAFKKSHKANFSQFIQENGEVLGLKSTEFEPIIKHYTKRHSGIICTPEIAEIRSKLVLEKLRLDFKILEKESINLLSNLSTTRGMSFELIIPQVIPSQNFIRKGEKFEAKIGLGPYDFKFLASDIKMTIDGKPISFDNGRFANYTSPPLTESETIITIAWKIRNPLTKQFESEWENYTYTIKAISE